MNKMEIYRLKAFITIADEQNLTKAAEALFITQPALSNQIKLLEEELGVKLFKRDAKGMFLTDAGEILVKEAKELLDKIEDFKRKAKYYKSEISGKMNIGLNAKPEILKADSICRNIFEKYPKVKLNLIQSITPEIIKNIKKENIQIGFVFGDINEADFTKIKLSTMEIELVYPKDFHEKLSMIKDIKELSGFPWILFDRECPFKKVMDDFFEEKGIKPEKFMIVNQESLVISLIKSGQGISVMLKDEAKEAFQNNEIYILPDIHLTVELSLIYLKEEEKNPLIKSVIDCIKDSWKS